MWSLIIFSFAMLIGCYLCGCIPLAFNLSEHRLRWVTIFGVGLLLGTSLAVIIPEGVNSLYDNVDKERVAHALMGNEVGGNHIDNGVKAVNAQVPNVKNRKLASETVISEHGTNGYDPHRLIGLALVSGFLLMLLIDHGFRCEPHVLPTTGNSEDSTVDNGTHMHVLDSRVGFTATLGLVVHAAADGIALGAASSTSHFQLEIIVFMAIILHKGPAAFGLVTFLLHENLDRRKIRKHLLIFSLAAPIMAILTYICLNQGNREALQRWNATGLALLFSGGTFLYVSTVHILPEVLSKQVGNRFKPLELVIIIFSSCIPLFLSLGHSH